MKFLEVATLSQLSCAISALSLGDCQVYGRIEAYSCKPTDDDKKLSRSLEKQGWSDSELPSRRTLLNIISTMNSFFPDYDFSTLRRDNFTICDVPTTTTTVNNTFAEILEPERLSEFIATFWKALNDTIDVSQCEIYSYLPDADSDPLSEDGKLWSMNYFFHNKKLKKMVYFTLCTASKSTEYDDDEDADPTGQACFYVGGGHHFGHASCCGQEHGLMGHSGASSGPVYSPFDAAAMELE
eukprot:gnl/Hemi2/17630_TR5818_c0_g1_i1.p1 gnl/Hemi2/17630_TR5818_c0_g1~~gnl/Hemi2/17630_TR5818_c0_g1_i1.p1  ORF type:complete len:240 (-),score=59.19 gnl/Hemi2/17630_TR5818_c0_g1_i1:231-950(-)